MKLKRFHCLSQNIQDDKLSITGQDAVHLKSVMRLNVGDSIIASCGDGKDYICEIIVFSDGGVDCRILETKKNQADPHIKVTLYQALLKSDKLELVTQKITEIGLTALVLFESEFCVVKKKDNNNKIERLNKIAIEATKQCGRGMELDITPTISFKEMLQTLKQHECVLFAYEGQRVNKITEIKDKYSDIAIIIGSEGGFSQSECEQLNSLLNVRCITLGNRILRAETASIVASAITMEHFEDIRG